MHGAGDRHRAGVDDHDHPGAEHVHLAGGLSHPEGEFVRLAADVDHPEGRDDRRTPTRPPARTRARKAALDILFESEQRTLDTGATLTERQADAAAGGPVVRDYTVELVLGVRAQRARIDDLLSTYAESWSLDRMAAVDRTILRIATWELLAAPDVPAGVAISEAVGLARDLSTDSSPAFVNGVLARIRDVVPRPTPTAAEPSTAASATAASATAASATAASVAAEPAGPVTDGADPAQEAFDTP